MVEWVRAFIHLSRHHTADNGCMKEAPDRVPEDLEGKRPGLRGQQKSTTVLIFNSLVEGELCCVESGGPRSCGRDART